MAPPRYCAWFRGISTSSTASLWPRNRRPDAMAVVQRHAEEDLGETHELNVTPFTDVILVLLIIFMVGAPLATVDMAVDLPTSEARPSARPDKPIFLTIHADNSITLADKPVTLAGLPKALDGQFHGDKEQRIFLQAD